MRQEVKPMKKIINALKKKESAKQSGGHSSFTVRGEYKKSNENVPHYCQ